MGRVLEELARRLAKAVTENSTVLWFDPEQAYQTVVDQLRGHEALAGVELLAFDGSFLALRHAAEPFLNAGFGTDHLALQRLICYVPVEPADTFDALAEIEALGVMMRPGANTRALNSRLSLVAKAALASNVPETRMDEILKGIQNGSLTITDLERLGNLPESSLLGLLFGTANATDVALLFLSSDERDPEIQSKNALPLLIELFQTEFGLPDSGTDTPGEVRAALAQYLLSGEYLLRLGGAAPVALAGLPQPTSEAQRAQVLEMASRWRNDARMQTAYARAADLIQDRLRIADGPVLDLDLLEGLETFRVTERWRQAAVANAVSAGRYASAGEVARRSKHGFWHNVTPVTERTLRWQLLDTISRLYSVASQIEEALISKPSASAIAQRYVANDEPWCVLDEAQRRLEADFGLHETASPVLPGGPGRDELELLVEQARARYREVANALAERFTRSLLAEGFDLDGLTRQRDLFSTVVQPEASHGKTAYVIVDALRYEMVKSIRDHEFGGWKANLSAAVASVPTLTPVGMAALMPEAQRGITLELRSGALVPTLGANTVLKDRAARVKYLKQAHSGQVAVFKLDDLTPASERTRQELAKADFIVVTSTEIDEAGENVSSGQARAVMESVLDDLRRAMHALRDVGKSASTGQPIDRVVVVADHGFIFAGEVSEGEKIDSPGPGAHRRVWIGQGGSESPSFARFRARDVDLKGDLEFAVPWNLSVFRTSGGTAYMHGGLSPQELLVPVLVLDRADRPAASTEAKVNWTISIPQDRITNRIFFATVRGTTAEMLPAPEKVGVKLEVRNGTTPMSEMRATSGSFDESSRVVTIPRNPENAQEMNETQIALMITDDSLGIDTVSLHLQHADTGVELSVLPDVPLSIM